MQHHGPKCHARRFVCCSHGLTFTLWGCCRLCFWHKPAKLADSALVCSCVSFCLYGPFNCISFHKFSRQLSAFSLCSSGLFSALLVLSSIYLSMKVSFSPDVILCGCPYGLTFTLWGRCGLCFWHKPTELADSFLFCSFVCFCLFGPFNCISFHKFSRQLSVFSLSSCGLSSALLVLSTECLLYISLWKSPSAQI